MIDKQSRFYLCYQTVLLYINNKEEAFFVNRTQTENNFHNLHMNYAPLPFKTIIQNNP
jgi:hypothetical protein